MREILFRGKRTDNGEWVEGCLSKSRNIKEKPAFLKWCIDHEVKGLMLSEIVDFETVGQYTGLTDKNGVKIFEGDICKDSDTGSIYVIIWDKYQWECKTIKSGYVLILDCAFPLWQWDNCKENNYRTLEIIGNIHDNPKLLEVKT